MYITYILYTYLYTHIYQDIYMYICVYHTQLARCQVQHAGKLPNTALAQ